MWRRLERLLGYASAVSRRLSQVDSSLCSVECPCQTISEKQSNHPITVKIPSRLRNGLLSLVMPAAAGAAAVTMLQPVSVAAAQAFGGATDRTARLCHARNGAGPARRGGGSLSETAAPGRRPDPVRPAGHCNLLGTNLPL